MMLFRLPAPLSDILTFSAIIGFRTDKEGRAVTNVTKPGEMTSEGRRLVKNSGLGVPMQCANNVLIFTRSFW